MRKKVRVFLSLVIFLMSPSVLAWNAAGHRVVALVAYANLTPMAKRQVDFFTQDMFHSRSAERRFLQAAVWPDRIKYDEITAFNDWHFIDLIPAKNGKLQAFQHENVVWAIDQSNQVIKSAKPNTREKALFLALLTHFVGDVHQPLHCEGLYKGGNDYRINAGFANNLHAYWDNGAGLLYRHYQRRYGYGFTAKRQYDQWTSEIAAQLTQEYPQRYFQTKLQDQEAMRWALDSYAIAKKNAYQLPEHGVPTAVYTQASQQIVKQQLALAGYRLAILLNQAFAQ